MDFADGINSQVAFQGGKVRPFSDMSHPIHLCHAADR